MYNFAGPIPGCKACTNTEMTYCKDGSVINDHCCCDGSVNGELTIVLLDQQQSTKTFYILSLHYIHSMLQWLWKMEPSPWFLIDFFVFHFLQFLHAACVSRRVLRFDLRVKNRSKEGTMRARTIRAWRIERSSVSLCNESW